MRRNLSSELGMASGGADGLQWKGYGLLTVKAIRPRTYSTGGMDMQVACNFFYARLFLADLFGRKKNRNFAKWPGRRSFADLLEDAMRAPAPSTRIVQETLMM